MKYVHTNIITPDWKRLVDFYINVFECELVPPLRNQQGDWLSKGTGVTEAALEGAHLRLPGHGEHGPTLEIYTYKNIERHSPVNANAQGLGHLAFEVDDIHLTVNKIVEHGGSHAGSIVEKAIEGVGMITFVYMRDPDGNLIELQSWDYGD